MNIVGIYDFPLSSLRSNDKSVAIIKNDGESVYAYEEAKLSSVKFDGYCAVPEKSLMMGFKELKLKPYDIDRWAFVEPSVVGNFYMSKNELFLEKKERTSDLQLSEQELLAQHEKNFSIKVTQKFEEFFLKA
jgi:predicted NodU family carbamoyl transferase